MARRNKQFIGVDLHTDNFVVCRLRPCAGESMETYSLSPEGLDAFKSSLNPSDEIAVEATGNSSFFYEKIHSYVKRITIVAPGEFHIIGKSVKKTDENDARKLALFLSKGLLPVARLKSKSSQILASLISTRTLLVKYKVCLINKSHSTLIKCGIKVAKNKLHTPLSFEKIVLCKEIPSDARIELEIIHEQISAICNGIKKLEMEINIKGRECYGYENLLSISGIGSLSSAILISVIDDIEDFSSPKKLASYFGVVPKVRESNGNSKRYGLTKRGSKIGRSTLVQATWIATRKNPYLGDYYKKLKERGCSQKANIACSRKLLEIIYKVLKYDLVFYDFPNFKYKSRSN